jgi:hypothetical protein
VEKHFQIPEELTLDYAEITSIPPLPLWTLLAADKETLTQQQKEEVKVRNELEIYKVFRKNSIVFIVFNRITTSYLIAMLLKIILTIYLKTTQNHQGDLTVVSL